MIGDVAGDLLLMGAVAEGVDGVESLFAKLLREEEGGDDDGEDDHNKCDGGAEGAVFDPCGQPVIGALGDDGEDDGEDDGGEERAEEESAEGEDAEGDEEEGDLLPGSWFAALLHAVVAPMVDWIRVAVDSLSHSIMFALGLDSR
jgi:hypothetical protein